MVGQAIANAKQIAKVLHSIASGLVNVDVPAPWDTAPVCFAPPVVVEELPLLVPDVTGRDVVVMEPVLETTVRNVLS
jgi:hypothetical protein